MYNVISSINETYEMSFSGVARQKYNHEILKSEESYFQGQKIPRSRRISIICRSEVEGNKE